MVVKFQRNWLEISAILLFGTLVILSIALPLQSSEFSNAKYASAFNAALSIGTSGLVAFTFYYIVNERLDKKKAQMVRQGVLATYLNSKQNIAVAIIHASQKGGRQDISADSETIDEILSVKGFKRLFEGGREADEGFYAFQNQMSDRTSEFDEIVFNFRTMGRAFARLVDLNQFHDAESYNMFVRLDAVLNRIEHNGPGYDESKLLCRFIWEIFAGWNSIKGDIGYDPIEHAIENS